MASLLVKTAHQAVSLVADEKVSQTQSPHSTCHWARILNSEGGKKSSKTSLNDCVVKTIDAGHHTRS